MCGRFDQRFGPERLARAIAELATPLGAESATPSGIASRGVVVPSDGAIVVRMSPSLEVGELTFGVRTRAGSLVINARRETLGERPLFRGALSGGRCVVPIRGFYEFTGPRGARSPVFFHWNGELHWLCGLAVGEGLVVVTEPAGGPVAGWHDREPVVLDHLGGAAWLRDGELATGGAHDAEVIVLDRSWTSPRGDRDPLAFGGPRPDPT
ncbi:protein of unknown function DUF159 [Acidimicrobium ferrooxidans DSM 10331]|uniref:Abasic site processing protein n=1 Tax=Acidimicrobium ferrooxidans (strain DSM 10331 / JCM 15462 / NBRC 103882 / ICP) TaxID=525909 RepID=C7M351_ACIFD|nr:SOS response-associated peptidase family protein [Acidimicrobium ferrooxidans]ACU53445.1 protein of unknown function DUF159 [Acidimicrobium ferrooxidans DSM 10331]